RRGCAGPVRGVGARGCPHGRHRPAARARGHAPRRQRRRRRPGDRRGARYSCTHNMKLEGIHHITDITGDAPRNVDFYARVLGLRLVKQTVNQDDPTVYHLFYADEEGSAGADLTFFEYPGARPGRAGAGMIHTIVHRVASEESLDFWASRLAGEGIETERGERSLRFADPEGLGHELVVAERPDRPLVAHSSEIPDEHALQGFEAVRAYVRDPARSEALL